MSQESSTSGRSAVVSRHMQISAITAGHVTRFDLTMGRENYDGSRRDASGR
ncbi:hypothetical protein BaRGS_00000140, partial [Batillaria attramentaria]